MTYFAAAGGAAEVAGKDVTKSFAESDVTLSPDPGVGFPSAGAGGSETYTEDTTGSTSGKTGIWFSVPDGNAVHSLSVTTWTDAPDVADPRILRASDERELTRKTGTFAGGSTITLPVALGPGEYYLILDNPNSGELNRTNESGGTTVGPIVHEGRITGGETTYTGSSYAAFGIETVAAEPGTPGSLQLLDSVTSGSVAVEWPQPADLFAWDVVSFTRTLDGETADVYVEESDDGGATWSEVAGPVRRNDSIPIPDTSEMRFRVDLSTSSGGNPTIDSLARRYLL